MNCVEDIPAWLERAQCFHCKTVITKHKHRCNYIIYPPIMKNINSPEASFHSKINVCARLRPLTQSDYRKSKKERRSSPDIGTFIHSDSQTLGIRSEITEPKEFSFDHAFDAFVNTTEVYESACAAAVAAFGQGYNACIMCYGQSGAGKTYSMFGSAFDGLSGESHKKGLSDGTPRRSGDLSSVDIAPPSANPGCHGLFQLSVFDLFNKVRDIKNQAGVQRVSVLVSCFQIYLENITDLLAPQKKGGTHSALPNLEIREHYEPLSGDFCPTVSPGPYIHNLTAVRADDEATLIALVVNALRSGRIMRETSNNSCSSRSHAVVQLVLEVARQESVEGDRGGRERESEQMITVRSTLYCVDLAGSERLQSSESRGAAMKESASIGLAAGALQRCIQALRQQQTQAQHSGGRVVHVPYRESKLTRVVLQNCFGTFSRSSSQHLQARAHGAKTVLLLNLSPCARDNSDSLATCRFGKSCAALKPRLIEFNRGVVTGPVTTTEGLSRSGLDSPVGTRSPTRPKRQTPKSHVVQSEPQSDSCSDLIHVGDGITDSEVVLGGGGSSSLATEEQQPVQPLLPLTVKTLLKTPLKSRTPARGRVKLSTTGEPTGAVFSLKAFLHNCHVSAVTAAEANTRLSADSPNQKSAALTPTHATPADPASASAPEAVPGITTTVGASADSDLDSMAAAVRILGGDVVSPPMSTRSDTRLRTISPSPAKVSTSYTPMRRPITPLKPNLTPPRSMTPKLQHHTVLTPGRMTPTPGVLALTDFEDSPSTSACTSTNPSPDYRASRKLSDGGSDHQTGSPTALQLGQDTLGEPLRDMSFVELAPQSPTGPLISSSSVTAFDNDTPDVQVRVTKIALNSRPPAPPITARDEGRARCEDVGAFLRLHYSKT